MRYINRIAKLYYGEYNKEIQLIGTLLHFLTFKLNCKIITVQKDWLETVRIKYSKNNNTQKFNLNRKNSGIILESLYEDINVARENEK